MKLAPIADRIAAQFRPNPPMPSWAWERMRDYADMQSGGELDMLQLDMLTDMIVARLAKRAVQP